MESNPRVREGTSGNPSDIVVERMIKSGDVGIRWISGRDKKLPFELSNRGYSHTQRISGRQSL